MRLLSLARRYETVSLVAKAALFFSMVCLCSVAVAARGKAAKGAAGRIAPKAAPIVASALERGKAALEAKDLATAARLLTEAYRSTPRTELLFHLAQLAVAEGRVLEAHDLYRRYLADPARDPDEAATKTAEQFVSQPPPPGGTVSVQSDPGAFVVVDQRVVGTLPLLLPLFLSSGEHTVALEFPSKRLEAPVRVSVGRLTEVRLSRSSGAVVVSVIPAILHYAEVVDVAAADARLLADTTEQAARGEQYTLLAAQLAVGQAAELKECLKQESCQRQLAVKNKSNFVLQEGIRQQGDPKQPTWQLELRLLRVDVEQPAAQGKAQCAGCTAEAAAARLKELTGKVLAEGLLRPRGTLQVTSEPAAATLRIGDGAPVQAPYSATLWAGRYELRASLPGYKADERSVEVTDGKGVEVKLTLRKDGPTEPLVIVPKPKVRTPRPKWRLALGGVMIGAGIGLSALGAVGLVKHGDCETEPAEGDTCPLIYSTQVPGGIALGGGILLIGGGALLMGVPGPLR
jgi:hypothetical protein